MTNRITQKQYNAIKNRAFVMVSYDVESGLRTMTTHADMLELFEYQMIRPDQGHIVMLPETYSAMEKSVRYGRDVKPILEAARENRFNWRDETE